MKTTTVVVGDRVDRLEQRPRAAGADSLGALQERRAARRPSTSSSWIPCSTAPSTCTRTSGPTRTRASGTRSRSSRWRRRAGCAPSCSRTTSSETAGLAYLVRKYGAQGIEVFGAVTLDTPTGGVNPQAVRYMVDVTGGWGRIVWLPTHDSEHEVAYNKDQRPSVARLARRRAAARGPRGARLDRRARADARDGARHAGKRRCRSSRRRASAASRA